MHFLPLLAWPLGWVIYSCLCQQLLVILCACAITEEICILLINIQYSYTYYLKT